METIHALTLSVFLKEKALLAFLPGKDSYA